MKLKWFLTFSSWNINNILSKVNCMIHLFEWMNSYLNRINWVCLYIYFYIHNHQVDDVSHERVSHDNSTQT